MTSEARCADRTAYGLTGWGADGSRFETGPLSDTATGALCQGIAMLGRRTSEQEVAAQIDVLDSPADFIITAVQVDRCITSDPLTWGFTDMDYTGPIARLRKRGA